MLIQLFFFNDTATTEIYTLSLHDALPISNEEVDLLFIDDKPSDIQLPSSVELEVTQTEPGLRGDTASGGGNKPATVETGATVNVPLFVNIGDRIKIQTETGQYMSRA